MVVMGLVSGMILQSARPALARSASEHAHEQVYLPQVRSGANAAIAGKPQPPKGNGFVNWYKAGSFSEVKNLDAPIQAAFGPLDLVSPVEAKARMLLTHARNQKRLAAAGVAAASAGAESTDIDVDGDGKLDVAVIVDNGQIIVPAVPANPLDLATGTQIRYTPNGNSAFDVSIASGLSLDANIGGALALNGSGSGSADDNYQSVALGFAFPFLGNSYSTLFVGSDGHITFGAPEFSSTTRDAARHISGPPRLSPLFTDLDPSCQGSVHAQGDSNHVVVTWQQVPLFAVGSAQGCTGTLPTSTFQATLHANGTIEFTYGALDANIGTAGIEAVTGIAEGNSEGPLNEIDMTGDLPATFDAGAIFEQFSAATPETFDLVALAQEFYRTHDDKYDFLVTFTDFEIFGGGTAFSAGIKNQTLGLGLATYDFTDLVGSDGELESFLWMNNIYLWAGSTSDDYINPQVHRFSVTTSPRLMAFLGGRVTPTTAPYELAGMLDITGPGNKTGYTHHARALIHENPHTEARAPQGTLRYDMNSAISIMFQEADHRWEAFTAFVHPTKGIVIPDSFDLLGRDLAHWSTFFNTRVADSPFTAADGMPRFSGMEGNALIHLDLVNGQIVDKDNPSRVFADPGGRLKAAFDSCAAQKDSQQASKGLFLTEPDQLIDGSTELDQYFMGIRRAEEVSPFWYVDEPSSPLDGRSLDEPFPLDFIRGSTFNVDDIGFCGVRVELTVEDITSLGTIVGNPARGPRIPAIGDEHDLTSGPACDPATGDNCVDVKTMAWVLLVRSGPPNSEAHLPAIQRLNEYRLAWQEYTDGPALGGRNADGIVRPPDDPGFIPKFDTSLEPDIY